MVVLFFSCLVSDGGSNIWPASIPPEVSKGSWRYFKSLPTLCQGAAPGFDKPWNNVIKTATSVRRQWEQEGFPSQDHIRKTIGRLENARCHWVVVALLRQAFLGSPNWSFSNPLDIYYPLSIYHNLTQYTDAGQQCDTGKKDLLGLRAFIFLSDNSGPTQRRWDSKTFPRNRPDMQIGPIWHS